MPHESASRGRRAGRPLQERRLWIPQMSWGGAVAFAAAFRSVSIDAKICPDGDSRTLELGSRHTSGEECLPARTTLGNFLKIVEAPAVPIRRRPSYDRGRPCRFGQYAPMSGCCATSPQRSARAHAEQP
jgi:predicted nucleotide-binding protein (sugar kinase/HSP70/actin superfamily)